MVYWFSLLHLQAVTKLRKYRIFKITSTFYICGIKLRK
jgi:hypothetical protein